MHDDDDDESGPVKGSTVAPAPAQIHAPAPQVSAQEQIEALQRQLSEMQQQSVPANGAAAADAQPAK